MKKMFILLVLFTLSMNYVNSSYATEVIDGDPDNPTPDYCNEPIVEGSSFDYSVCGDDSTTETPTLPEYCEADYVGALSEDQIIACDTYNLATTTEPDYSSLADRSEYDRIEKIESVWYGVINITDLNLQSAFIGYGDYMNVIGITFSRETQSLKQIEIDFTTVQDSCLGWLTLLGCIGSKADAYSDTIILNNKFNTNDFLDFINGDNIIVGNDDYDYYLYVPGDEFATITVVRFTYILTDLEIDDLKLDIQEQYEIEKNIILNNPLLTNDEKLIQIIALIEEYKEFEIDFGEEMTSICIETDTQTCTAINENPASEIPGEILDEILPEVPDWAQDLLSTILKGIGQVVAAFTVAAISGVIAFILIKKALATTGSAAIGTTKITFKSSMWWGSNIGNGILVFLETIENGMKFIWKTLVGKVIFIVLILLSIVVLIF